MRGLGYEWRGRHLQGVPPTGAILRTVCYVSGLTAVPMSERRQRDEEADSGFMLVLKLIIVS